MTENPAEKQVPEHSEPPRPTTESEKLYSIQFRKDGQLCSATSSLTDLKRDEVVMAQTDKGLEPTWVLGAGLPIPETGNANPVASFIIQRRATAEETEKFDRLRERECEAFEIGLRHIERHKLPMKLVRVERFFNGGKIIFYFTADNRVDFRELVKDLVQEFRTRVEIRQIGVRHETKMLGGLGCCGRELCCASYIKDFAPVSIKMAKAQNLSLNPAKISGLCNRLLCCLTYEYETYNDLRKNMPKPGKTIILDNQSYKILQVNALAQSITVVNQENKGPLRTLTKDEWQQAEPASKPPQKKPGRAPKRGPKEKVGKK